MTSDQPTHFEALYPQNTREEEIKRLLEHIKGGKSIQLIGIPGSGKSNILRLLSFNRTIRQYHLGEHQKWFHFVYMDFSEVKKRSLYDVMKYILISITSSLSEREYESDFAVVDEYLKTALPYEDELILSQALKKAIDYLAIQKELTIVLLFDRFEQYIPDITEQFFLNLRILRNRAKYRFSSIFSLTRPLEETLEVGLLSDFGEFLIGNHVYPPIYDPVGVTFRFAYIEKITGKKTDQKLKNELIELTGGHVQLMRIAYETVLSTDEKTHNLPELLLRNRVIVAVVREIWNSLLPSEQLALKDISHHDTLPAYLLNTHLVHEKKVAIPLLTHVIDKHEETKQQTITYNQETNEIMKNDESITEQLSPSEFRLLRFLLLNPGRVCEKEELITSVWKDTKTQEGVTDQALDQIIYRVRRKIEEDPNNPTHLITIKGRGVKFSA